MNFIPAPLSAVLIVLGTLFAPTARPLVVMRGMFGGAVADRLPRQGWTQGPIAGALGLSLSGPRRLDGIASLGAWIGDGRARANATDIARDMRLYLITGFLGLVPIVLMALISHRFWSKRLSSPYSPI